MPVPMTEEQILKNIHSSYHPTFKRIQQTHIQPNEEIFAAADASHTSKYQEDYGKRKISRVSFSCLIIVTSHRWIRSGMSWRGMADSITYRKIGSRLGSWLSDEVYYEHKWVFPPKRLPTEKQMGRKSFSERVGEYIREVQLSELEAVRNRNDYSVLYKGQQIALVEVTFQSTWVAFKAKDGELVYNLLQLAAQNNGCILSEGDLATRASDQLVQENSVQKLKQIKEMLKAGLITEADYEAKKTEIFSRM
jgi:hypothetical protein